MKEDRTDFSMKRTNFYTKIDPFVREKRPAAGRERCVLHVLFEKDAISTWKKTDLCMKRNLFLHEKRPIST